LRIFGEINETKKRRKEEPKGREGSLEVMSSEEAASLISNWRRIIEISYP
jgi:hypothetical protein